MSRMLYQLSYAAVIKSSIAYFALFCQGHQKLYFKENNRYRKKQAALPAAALPFARGTSRSALVAQVLRQTVIGIGLRKLFMKQFACHSL